MIFTPLFSKYKRCVFNGETQLKNKYSFAQKFCFQKSKTNFTSRFQNSVRFSSNLIIFVLAIYKLRLSRRKKSLKRTENALNLGVAIRRVHKNCIYKNRKRRYVLWHVYWAQLYAKLFKHFITGVHRTQMEPPCKFKFHLWFVSEFFHQTIHNFLPELQCDTCIDIELIYNVREERSLVIQYNIKLTGNSTVERTSQHNTSFIKLRFWSGVTNRKTFKTFSQQYPSNSSIWLVCYSQLTYFLLILLQKPLPLLSFILIRMSEWSSITRKLVCDLLFKKTTRNKRYFVKKDDTYRSFI